MVEISSEAHQGIDCAPDRSDFLLRGLQITGNPSPTVREGTPIIWRIFSENTQTGSVRVSGRSEGEIRCVGSRGSDRQQIWR